MNRPLAIAAGAVFCAVIAVTLSPLRFRPDLGPPQVERFAAWALVGGLAVAAAPRRWRVLALATTSAAVGSEVLQLLIADRHAHVRDGLAKAAGAAAGVLLTRALLELAYSLPSPRARRS